MSVPQWIFMLTQQEKQSEIPHKGKNKGKYISFHYIMGWKACKNKESSGNLSTNSDWENDKDGM